MPAGFLVARADSETSERLLAGSGQNFADLAAASDASRPIPAFALPQRLRASIVTRHRQLVSPNLVARIVGSNPALAREHVVISAHLDHVGIGPAIDDGSGVATVLDIAQQIAKGPRPKRSILFVVVTAEEAGLLGSSYFAKRPSVDGTIVADINFDVLLPLWPLTSVQAQGDRESTLGDIARATAARHGLEIVPDPLPNRNSFTRTDQYSFVRAGIPALAFKFGFTPGSEAFRIEHDWRATRYHSPSDDIHQPGLRPAEAIRLDDFAADVARSIADDPQHPRWLETSLFRSR